MDAIFRALVENSNDAVVLVNADGTIRFASESSARLLGYTLDERVGHSGFEMMHPDDVPRTRAAFAEVLNRPGVPTPTEYRVLHKDGTWRNIEAIAVNRLNDPAIGAVVVNYRDVTTRRRAEEALRRSEARYRSLIQGAAYGIYRTTLGGTILDANPALAHMLGYESVDALMALNMSEIYASAAERVALVQRHLDSKEPGLSSDVTWRRRGGGLITVRVTARFVSLPEGDANCFEGIAEDVTERRILEEQVRQAQKLEAVGRLARGVAHDFNNVLAAIVGCSDLLAMRLGPEHPAREEADEIRKAAERGAALTRQLLAFSRRQALDATMVDVHEAMRGIESMIVRLTGEATVRLLALGPAPYVRVEPGQVEQVLLNLVVNARDAVEADGAIDIIADAVDLDEHAALNYPGVVQGPYARIVVRDTGRGIDPDVQRHVFEPFFTTKGPSKGTGLGLSIVYGIAKEAGGTVTFTTSPQGTMFEVLLPRV